MLKSILQWLQQEPATASAKRNRNVRLGLESLESREVPTVTPVGDPRYSMNQGYFKVTDLKNTYAGSISGHNGADVDLFAVKLNKGEKLSVEMTDTWNQNQRKGGLWGNIRLFNPDGTPMPFAGYHQNVHDSFTVGMNKGVANDGVYYVGISARGNDKYNIAAESGAVKPTQTANVGEYSLKFIVPGKPAIPASQLSGLQWVSQYPTSTSLTDLAPGFRQSAQNFINALNNAGAQVHIEATYRPPERAYLMHWAWMIDKEQYDPRLVPAMAGVNIQWAHLDADGRYDAQRSKAAAKAMVLGYGIVHQPALQSRHTARGAVDMGISWQGVLHVIKANGQVVHIASGPKNGNNQALWAVGASYGVIKLASDPPHWSDNGH